MVMGGLDVVAASRRFAERLQQLGLVKWSGTEHLRQAIVQEIDKTG